MKKTPIYILLILSSITCRAQQQVSMSTARMAAINTMRYNRQMYSEADIDTVHLYISGLDTLLYEVKFYDNHSVLLSGSLACQPVLGYNFAYADETVLDHYDEIPPGLQFMIQEYIDQIELCFANDTITLWYAADWANLMNYNKHTNDVYEVVEPLITTLWGQSSSNMYNFGVFIDSHAYNYYVSETGSDCDNIYCPTGCVATAMAQIMNYWKHPVYNPLYGSNQFDWCNMPNELCTNSPHYKKERNAVAWLMRKCGLAIDMDYCMNGDCESGAYIADARYAFEHSFGYDDDAIILERNSHNIIWRDLVIGNLEVGYPILYSGNNGRGYESHAFICDGYRSDYTFHFNLGWNGAYHQYWLTLNTLCFGEHNYSYDQKAIFNIHPAYNSDYCSFSMSLEDHFTSAPLMIIDRTAIPKTFKILESVSRSSQLHEMYRTIYTFDSIEYVAHTKVILHDGFHAVEGSYFTAYIDECEICEEDSGEIRFVDIQSLIDTELSLESSNIDNKVYIIPNPNNGTFYVSLSNNEEEIIGITIYDAMGRTIYSNNKFNGGEIVLPLVKQGLFFVTVILNDKKITEKIIVQ